MTLFDGLASTMDGLVGTGMGGWVLGAFVIGILMFPLIFLSRNREVSEKTFLFLAAVGISFNVGVGFWANWTIVFVMVIVLWGGLIFRGGGGGGGGVA